MGDDMFTTWTENGNGGLRLKLETRASLVAAALPVAKWVQCSVTQAFVFLCRLHDLPALVYLVSKGNCMSSYQALVSNIQNPLQIAGDSLMNMI